MLARFDANQKRAGQAERNRVETSTCIQKNAIQLRINQWSLKGKTSESWSRRHRVKSCLRVFEPK